MDSEQARIASTAAQLGAHAVTMVLGVTLSDEQCLAIDDFIHKVANGEETVVGTGAEMRLAHPGVTEQTREKLEKQSREAAKMVIWWHDNARL